MFSVFRSRRPSPPQRWLDPSKRTVLAEAIVEGLAERLEEPPYRLKFDAPSGDAERWEPPSFRLKGRLLVTMEFAAALAEDGADPMGAMDAFYLGLDRAAERIVMIAPGTAVLWGAEDAVAVHAALSRTCDLTRYSYTVIDLAEGGGLAWNAVDGVLIVLARPD